MKKSRFFSALLCVGLIFVLLPTAAKAALWEVPAGLNPGDTFRWVFVTSGSTAADDGNINYYNGMINDWLLPTGPLSPPVFGVAGKETLGEIQWKAIVSTPTTNAIDNIEVSSAPIYNPFGTRVAVDSPDLFDGSIESPIMITELGGSYWGDVYTGSSWDGRADVGYEAGSVSGWTRVGDSVVTSSEWLEYIMHYDPTTLPIYSISEELYVVPVPDALILAATGLLSTLGLKRLRRKHQE